MLNEAARAVLTERHHSSLDRSDEASCPSAVNDGLNDDEAASAANCGPAIFASRQHELAAGDARQLILCSGLHA